MPAALLVGSGPLADILTELLRAQGRRCAAVPDLNAAGRRLQRADPILLLEPADPAAALATLAAARPARAAPPRVLLISDGPRDWSLPDGLAPEVVDLQQRAARLLLRRFPLHFGADPRFGQRIHLVLAGRAAPLPALLPQALRVAQYGDQPALVSVLDPDPAGRRAALAGSYPQAHHCAELRFLTPADPALLAGPPPSLVVIAAEPPERGLVLARNLAATLARDRGWAPPILLEVGDARPGGALVDWDGQLFPFSYRREVLAPARLLDGTDDALARIIHDHYRDSIEAQGRDPLTEAAGLPWERLAESYRDANRHQADHLWAKLALTDCRALPEDQVESFAFTAAEVERLAAMEHARWAADRWLAGWRWAPVRDNQRRQHPQLRPFAALSPAMQDLDRFAVRLAPTLLARSGLGVLRMLIVGVVEEAAAGPVPATALMDRLLVRLAARFPDRALVIATKLASPAARRLAQRALDRFGAGLFWLATAPPATLLTGLAPAEGAAFLRLLARAERRIPLPESDALARWLATRAQVHCHLAAAAPPGLLSDGAVRRVVLHPRGVCWGFEY